MNLKEYTFKKKKIGELLVEAGLIDAEDIDRILEFQDEANRPVGRILVDKGIISEEELVKVLALQFSVAYSMLQDYSYDDVFDEAVPKNLYDMFNFIPYHLDQQEQVLTIAVSDPNNFLMLENIKNATGFRIKYILSPEQKISELRQKIKGAEILHKQDKDSVLSAPTALKMIFSILESAVFEHAEQIFIEPAVTGFHVNYRVCGKNRHKYVLSLQQGEDILEELSKIRYLPLTINGKKYFFNFEQIFSIGIIQVRNLVSHDFSGIIAESQQEIMMSDAMKRGIIFASGRAVSGRRNTLYNISRKLHDIPRVIISDVIDCADDVSVIKITKPDIHEIEQAVFAYNPRVLFCDFEIRREYYENLKRFISAGMTVFIKCCDESLGNIINSHEPIAEHIAGAVIHKMRYILCKSCRVSYAESSGSKSAIHYRETGCAKCGYSGYSAQIPAAVYVQAKNDLSETCEPELMRIIEADQDKGIVGA